MKLWNLETAEELHTFTGHADSVNAVAIAADGKRAISASLDKTLKLWSLETGKELHTFTGHSRSVNAVAITANGKRAISASSDGTLKLWNLETTQELHTFTDHSRSVYAVAIAADGKRAISGSDDNTLKLWNLETTQELHTFNGHSRSIYAVAITADGKRAISASSDNTLKLWNLETGQIMATFTGDAAIRCCGSTPNGITIMAGEASGRLHFLRLEKLLPITTNNRRIPGEFQQTLQEKSRNFVGREFVFTAIADFLNRYDRGYFTIVGPPGSGKSAIIAKYVTENSDVFYYNAQIQGKNRAEEFLEEFLKIISTQIGFANGASLQLILQHISDQLEPKQQFIIAIDSLDAIDYSNQSIGSNLFYLPRYLPKGIYFLLARRPFFQEKSGLLIEAPSQLLNLTDYSKENRQDIQAYIQQYIHQHIQKGLHLSAATKQRFGVNPEELIQQLTSSSENNFMYVSQILTPITRLRIRKVNETEYLPHTSVSKGIFTGEVGTVRISFAVETVFC